GVRRPDRALAEDLVDRALEVGHRHDLAVLSDREHPGLGAHRMDVGPRRALASAREDAVVDVRRDAHLPRVDLEDRHAGLVARDRDLDDPIEAARAQEGFVEDVRPVRGPDDLHFPEGVEAIEFREQLHERPLDLPVAGRRDLEALRPDRIELVDEHDGGGFLAGELEEFPHEPCALADVLLDQFRPDESDERRLRTVGDRFREERLPRAGRADQEDSFRRLDPDLAVQVRLKERVFDGLAQFAHLDLESSDVLVSDGRFLDDLCARDDRIQGRREDAHHGECLLVQRDARPDHEVLLRDVIRGVHDEVRTRRRLHDHAAVRQDVPDVADDQRRTLEAIEFLFEPPDLLLKPAELGLRIPLLALDPPGRLQELVVAVLERGDPLRHFLRELTYLVVVHRIVRWVDVDTQTGELELAEDFPQRIRQAREARGWKQADLGAKINERVSVIAKLEAGTISPGDSLVRKLERELGIRLKERVEPVAVKKQA